MFKTGNCLKRLAFLSFSASVAVSLALSAPTAFPEEDLARLADHYVLDSSRLTTDQEGRASGLFHLSGALSAPLGFAYAALSGALDEAKFVSRGEAVFSAFVAANRSLLGLDEDGSELRLARVDVDEFEVTHLRYHRYVSGVRVAGMEVLAHVRADGVLEHVSGHIVRTEPKARALAKRQEQLEQTRLSLGGMLTIAQAKNRVAKDLDLPPAGLDFLRAELLLTRSEPHMILELDVRLVGARLGRFVYRFDAMNGALLTRRSALQF